MDVRGFAGSLQSLNGLYDKDTKDINHGRPVYRKNTKEQTCCIYWWDNRDGEAMKGWWIAPVVGGEHVWTQCTVDADEPPRTGWKVPWHGSVDRNVQMTTLSRSAGGSAKRTSPPVSSSDRNVKPRYPDRNVPVASNWPGKNSMEPPVPAHRADDNRGVHQVNVAEDAVRKAQLASSNFEAQDKAIRFGNSAIHSCRRVPLSDKNKARLDTLERELSVAETKLKREMKEKEMQLLEDLKGDQMKERKAAVDKHMEDGNESAGILNSDVADHLSPEDVFESTELTDKALAIIATDLEGLRSILVETDEEAKRLSKLGGSLGHPFKELTDFRAFITKLDKQYNDIKTLSEKYKKKAHADVAAKKKEEEELRRKEELEKHACEAKVWLEETSLFLEEVDAAFSHIINADPQKVDAVSQAREQLDILKALSRSLDATYPEKMKILDERLKQVIASGPLYDAQKKMKEMKHDIEKNDLKKVKENEAKLENFIREQVMLEMSLLLRQKYADMTELFAEIGGEDKKVTLEAFLECCRNAGAPEEVLDNVSIVFNTIAVGGHVLEDEFPFLTEVHYKLARPTWLTKTISIVSRSESVRLVKGDIVQVLGMPQREEPSEQMPHPPLRIQVRTQKEPVSEGWVTVTGNKGLQFTKMHTFEYQVIKETVMTDQFEMKGFKVLKRLKADDRFRALGYGVVETTSKAVRIKGRLLHNSELRGWATLLGNQGSAYLRLVD
eukprot:GEMP01012729.1.p1 GENE.GEMP01012729.1~~GEMP01012729.1.p1  ORF type:complete len:726 (+),score=210.82 GEMP01012729.1:137-2314(+)